MSFLFCDNEKFIENRFVQIDKKHHEFEFWKVLTMIPPEMKKPVFELGKGCLQIKGEDYLKACLEFMSCLKKGNLEVIELFVTFPLKILLNFPKITFFSEIFFHVLKRCKN